jgi:hypothetical protein
MLLRVEPPALFSWLFLNSSHLLPFLLAIPLFLSSLTAFTSGSARLSLIRSGFSSSTTSLRNSWAPPAGTPGPFSLSDSGALEQAATQAGFSEVSSESLELILELDSAADYAQFMQAVSPSIHALLASQSTEQQERIWQAIRETVQKRYGHADGTVRIPGETICLVARC